jgi:hypothetical protein
MRLQRDPTSVRLRNLLQGDPSVTIRWGEFTASSLELPELSYLDDLIELLEEGKCYLSGARPSSATAAAALDEELADLGARIGAQLRALNRTGLFVSAKRAPERGQLEDPETGTRYTAIRPTVRLLIRKSVAAA